MTDNIQTFLNTVAEITPPNFKLMMAGIATHYELYGTLSKKQRHLVYQNKGPCIVPDEWDDMRDDARIIETNKAAAPEFFGDPPLMPEFRITSEDAQRVMRALVDEPLATSPNDIFADTLFEIAAALQVCAFRLKEIT